MLEALIALAALADKRSSRRRPLPCFSADSPDRRPGIGV
jgi:hypothetical protein